MSNKLLIKIVYVAIIVVAIVMSKFVSENFIVIPKIIFWFESVTLIVVAFASTQTLKRSWEYMTNFHFIWNLIYFSIATFFIAYSGWFFLLGFYIPFNIIAIFQSVKLNKMVKDENYKKIEKLNKSIVKLSRQFESKESTND